MISAFFLFFCFRILREVNEECGAPDGSDCETNDFNESSVGDDFLDDYPESSQAMSIQSTVEVVPFLSTPKKGSASKSSGGYNS
jgi:hypothetical protein